MKFLFNFNFCSRDFPAAKRSAEVIHKFGPYIGSHLFIQPTQDTTPEMVKEIELLLNEQFDSHRTVYPYDTAPQIWPAGPNHLFARAARWVKESEFDYWYFWEPDCLPLRSGWMDAVKHEYESGDYKKFPFLGVINVTRLHDPDGHIRPVGTHMVGTGIYPKMTPRLAPNSVLGFGKQGLAWDVLAQEQIVPLTRHTKLIDHKWSTHKYTSLKQIPEECVVHHGCKDASLYELLMGKRASSNVIEDVKGSCPAAEAVQRGMDTLPDLEQTQRNMDGSVSVCDAIMPHVVAITQALCKDSITRRKIQRMMKKACLIA